MRTIHKIPLHMVSYQVYVLEGSRPKPLSVAVQNGRPCLWFEIEPRTSRLVERRGVVTEKAPTCGVTIYLVGTGDEVPEGATNFLGPLLLDGGALCLNAYWAP